MIDCDETHPLKIHILIKAVRAKGNWWVWVSALMLIFVVSCRIPTGSTVAKVEMHGKCDKFVAIKFMEEMGYTLAEVTDIKITTNWRTFYSGRATEFELEHHARIVVNLKKLTVQAQCYTTGQTGDYPCEHPLLLKRIRKNVQHVANRLPITDL